MTEPGKGSHHPLPSDPRSRHDRLPESIEDTRDRDDAEPDSGGASPTEPPAGEYRDPDGRPYPA